MKRDILIGIIAGAVALIVTNWHKPQPALPPGIYQVTVDQAKYNALDEIFAPPPNPNLDTRRGLEVQIDKIEVTAARFDWMLEYLADAAGTDIEADWKSIRDLAAPDKEISLNLHNVTVNYALHELLTQAAGNDARLLALKIQPGRVTVTLSEHLSKELVTRIYDVRDLIALAVKGTAPFQTPKTAPATQPQQKFPQSDVVLPPIQWMNNVTSPQEAADGLVKTLMEDVDPTSWRDMGGISSLRMIAGKLIVVQTRENQDEVAIWLEKMRRVFQ